MSFAEVEMGLPPVNEVTSPPPIQQQRRQSPNYEDVETDTPRSSSERISVRPQNSDNDNVFQVPPVRTSSKRAAPPPPLRRPSEQDERVYALAESEEPEAPDDRIARAQKCGGFVLVLLPGIFGALAVQFIKYLLDYHHVYVLSLCVFQGIFWPSLFFVAYTLHWMKRNLIESISCGSLVGRRNLAEIAALSILASCAVVLQIISLLHIDITVSLAISFTPLVFAALMQHISLERRFPIELIVTSFTAYTGIVILSMAAVTTSDWRLRRNLLVGIGTAIGSMLLAIPACLLLPRLRRNQVEDSLTATIFAFFGTVISLILMGTYLGFGLTFSGFPKPFEANPGFIASLVAFILCATFFQMLDSIYRSAFPSIPTTRIILLLSATRMGVFVFSGIWEILKRGFYPGYYGFPSVFSIFGVILIMIACGLTVGYQAWYKQVPRIEDKDGQVVTGKPFEFFPWLFSRSFV